MTTDKIRAIVVEDEPNSQKALVKLISQHCPDVKVVAAVYSVSELLEELQETTIDLMFLDINLGKESGFDALKEIQQTDFQIVVTTAHRHHALKAFEHRAVHFLLKPVVTDDLIEAVSRTKTRSSVVNRDALSHLNTISSRPKKLALPDINGFEMITEDGIIRLEGEGAYTYVHLKSGEKRMISKSLGHFETLLNPKVFIRVHKKHIVNVNDIQRVNKGGKASVLLSSGITIPVARARKNEIFSKIVQ